MYKIFTILRRSNLKILQNFVKNFGILKKNFQNFTKFHKISQKFHKISKNFQNFRKFWKNLEIFDNFLQIFEFRVVQKCVNLVDLEKCWKMTIWLQKSAPMQPRTSLAWTSVIRWRWSSGRPSKRLPRLARGLSEYLVAKIGVATAENEPDQVWSFGCEIGEIAVPNRST